MAKVFSTLIDPIGFGIGKAITGKGSSILNVNPGKKDSGNNTPALPSAPALPDPAKIKQEEQDRLRRAAALRTQTQFSSPLGVQAEGNVGQKTVLGG